MSSAETLQADIFALDQAADYPGLQNYILNCGQPPTNLIGVVYHLMQNVRLRGGYLTAKLLHLQGVRNPIVSFALVVGGLKTGNHDDAEAGKRLLRQQYDKQDAEGQRATYKIVEELVMPLLTVALSFPDYTTQMLRLLEVMKPVVPVFRTIFDFTAPTPDYDLAVIAAESRARARMIDFQGPPADAPRKPRRVVVAIRELFFPHIANWRRFEQGPTTFIAMNNYGWDASFVGMQFNRNEISDARAIMEACIKDQADILVVDAVIYNFPDCAALLQDMRAQLPKLKVAGIYFDAWPISAARFKEHTGYLDVMWSASPDLPAWSQPEVLPKRFLAPLTRGGDYGGPLSRL